MTVPKIPAWEQAGRSIYSTARVHSINPSRLLHYLGIFGNCPVIITLLPPSA